MLASELRTCWRDSDMNECLKIYKAAHACACGSKILRPLATVLRHLDQFLFACHIGSRAQIGEGCVFQHNGLGVVISERAVIGDRCMLYQHVTIGALEDGSEQVPLIGDDVVIGAGATLLGPIKVGSGSKIGAGAVVLSDVPAGATAVGVPAKILGESA